MRPTSSRPMRLAFVCTWGQERCVNLGKNDKIQSIKNGRRELEKKMAESEKIIAEREKKIKALEEEYHSREP